MLNDEPIPNSVPRMAEVTLQNCSDEPIRIPGAIQRHGFLLGLDESLEKVILASENAEEYFATPLKLILGSPIDHLFERELLGIVRHQRCAVDPDGMVSYLGAFRIRGELFSVTTHCVEGKRILEFERQDRLVGAEMMNSIITNFVSTLSRLETEQELCAAVTRQVAQLTGFDRVLLYSFDEEGNGTVLAEANSGRLPSYLDLRFPASDIPSQARELYVLNTVRIIPDATYTPSPLRALTAEAPHVLDLSLSVLRSVSPIHLQYMRNMATLSSMSISIVSEGRLWGLIGCHHAEPRMVPYLVRSACDMLSKLVGTQLTTFRTASRLKTLTQFHAVQRQLLTHVAADFNYLDALAQQMPALMQITEAAGAALWIDGECHSLGVVPEPADIHRIVEWLETLPPVDVFETQQLSSHLPWTADLADSASGLLAIRISDVRQRYVLWFRPQAIRTVRWAGEPAKHASAAQQLHPRKSFEAWRETLRGQSPRWTDAEIESAREFRSAIVTVSLKRAEEEAEVSNARFEQLTHALPAKVFTADDSGELVYTNERWREHGLKGTGVWFADGHLSPEDEPRVAACWQHAVATGNDFEEEARFIAENGTLRWNLVRVVPFRRHDGARAGWVGSVVDLTERREREAALRMTEKLALTGRMTSVIAHEINNPLEAITNLLYLVRQDLPPAATEAAAYITQAESELERISGITKQTLRWSRENSGGTEQFKVGAIFTDVLRLFRGKLRNRHVTADVRGGEQVQLEGILGQVRQVIANLVSNAIDAAPVGGNIWMEAKHSVHGTVEIVVGDDGPGISAEHSAQLFQPFFSTKGDLGNGLGLYISREITERHGGSITVESGLNRGTVMHLVLPVHAQIRQKEAPGLQIDDLLLP